MEAEMERVQKELGSEFGSVVREMVPESELDGGEEEPPEMVPKRPRLAAPGQLEEEQDYVADLGGTGTGKYTP